MSGEPVAEGLVGVGRGSSQACQAPGDAQFVAEGEVVEGGEGAEEVEGRGEGVGGEAAEAAVRGEEVESALRPQQAVDAEPAAEVGEVGAAAHADVLAGVGELAGGGVGEGAGPPAEARACFQEGKATAAFREGDAGGQAGQPGAEDADAIGHQRRSPARRSLGLIAAKLHLRSQSGYSK